MIKYLLCIKIVPGSGIQNTTLSYSLSIHQGARHGFRKGRVVIGGMCRMQGEQRSAPSTWGGEQGRQLRQPLCLGWDVPAAEAWSQQRQHEAWQVQIGSIAGIWVQGSKWWKVMQTHKGLQAWALWDLSIRILCYLIVCVQTVGKRCSDVSL